MTSELALAVLVVAIVATRPLEEHGWRTGRVSDGTSALLAVGRLPALALGSTVLLGLEPLVVLVVTVLASALGVLLYPVTLGRLRRSSLRPQD